MTKSRKCSLWVVLLVHLAWEQGLQWLLVDFVVLGLCQ
jgi:hypothetical protein